MHPDRATAAWWCRKARRITRRRLACLATPILLLGVVSVLPPAPPVDEQSVVELVSAVELAPSAEDEDVLQVPLRRLIEPRLPHHAWFSDAACANFTTHFARPGSLPDARIVSRPRSGNTWTRFLLEAATGLVTCGISRETEMSDVPPTGAVPSLAEVRRLAAVTLGEFIQSGFIGEFVGAESRACLLAKTHVFPPAWRRLPGEPVRADYRPLAAVLLVRDPFRAVISMRHMMRNRSTMLQHSRVGADAFVGAEWEGLVAANALDWLQLADDWATSPRDTLLVAYERLVADPAAQLRRMLRFLGVTPPAGRLDCVLRHVEGPLHNRDHPVVPDHSLYSLPLRRTVWTRIRELNSLLTSRGYRRLPLESYSFFGEV